jgi:hypothetical protein
MDGGTNVTRALEAEVLAHEGARNGAVDVVSPFGHGGQKICVRPATKASRHGKKASVERRVEAVESRASRASRTVDGGRRTICTELAGRRGEEEASFKAMECRAWQGWSARARYQEARYLQHRSAPR